MRRAQLKKHASTLPTGLVPLRKINSALVIADGTVPDCVECVEKMSAFLKGCGIAVSAIYVDLRRIRKDTPVYVSGDNVLTRSRVNWYGKPKTKRTGHLFPAETGLLVNIRDSGDFTGDFISKTVRAVFKIGICDYPGNPFDLTVSGKTGADEADGGFSGDSGAGEGPASGNPAPVYDVPEKIDAICNFLKQIV